MSPAIQRLALFPLLWSASIFSQTLAITDVNVVDVVKGEVLPNQTILIRQGRIVQRGPSGAVKLPPNVARVLGDSKHLIPGLWDMHVHLRSDEKHPEQPLVAENEALLDLFLPNGVIGIRDMGGDLADHVVRWRDEISAGKRTGPRILTSGRKIDQSHGRQWAGTLPVNTPEQGRAAVQSIKKSGADFVKVRHASSEILAAVIDESKKLGLKTTGHLPLTMSIQAFVQSGFDGMEHDMYLPAANEDEFNSFLAERKRRDGTPWAVDGTEAAARLLAMQNNAESERVYRLMASRRFLVTPTAAMSVHLYEHGYRNYEADPMKRYIPASIWASWDPQSGLRRPATGRRRDLLGIEVERWRAAILPAHRLGVPMLVGTDCGANNNHMIPGFSIHEELQQLVNVGLTPAEVLRMATTNAAEWRNQADAEGSIEEGKVADLVLLNGNPLEDIRNAGKVEAVFVSGKYYSREELNTMLRRAESKR